MESLFIKVALLRSATLLKETSTKAFSCEICEIFQNIYFAEHMEATACDGSERDESENDDESYNECIEAVVRSCSSK